MASDVKNKSRASLQDRLLHDWVKDSLRVGGNLSYRNDIYLSTLEEGRLARSIVTLLSELLSERQREIIQKAFPSFGTSSRSKTFLERIYALSRERIETVLFNYLMYETEISVKELKQISRKLAESKNEKTLIENQKMIFNQESLKYYQLKETLESATDTSHFDELIWDLYPKKQFAKKYFSLCSQIIRLIK